MFGMGTGGALMPLSPEICFVFREKLAFPEAFREKDFSCLRRISPSFGFPGMRPENYTVKADLEIRFPLLISSSWIKPSTD